MGVTFNDVLVAEVKLVYTDTELAHLEIKTVFRTADGSLSAVSDHTVGIDLSKSDDPKTPTDLLGAHAHGLRQALSTYFDTLTSGRGDERDDHEGRPPGFGQAPDVR
jgi:hypothetical protein